MKRYHRDGTTVKKFGKNADWRLKMSWNINEINHHRDGITFICELTNLRLLTQLSCDLEMKRTPMRPHLSGFRVEVVMQVLGRIAVSNNQPKFLVTYINNVLVITEQSDILRAPKNNRQHLRKQSSHEENK